MTLTLGKASEGAYSTFTYRYAEKVPFTRRNIDKPIQEKETETAFAVRHLCACLMIVNVMTGFREK
jgi:hypothetical protein